MKDYKEIKTLKDACEAIGEDFEAISRKDAEKQLKVITRALNGDFDYKDERHFKYIPYFELKNNHFSFGGNFVEDIATAYEISLPELAFKSAEIAKYAGIQFIDFYKKNASRYKITFLSPIQCFVIREILGHWRLVPDKGPFFVLIGLK